MGLSVQRGATQKLYAGFPENQSSSRRFLDVDLPAFVEGVSSGQLSADGLCGFATYGHSVQRSKTRSTCPEHRRGMHGKNLQSRITRLQELIMRLWQEEACWKDDI
jgi:hypothetical protein